MLIYTKAYYLQMIILYRSTDISTVYHSLTYDHLKPYAIFFLRAHALIFDPDFPRYRPASPLDPNEAMYVPSRAY